MLANQLSQIRVGGLSVLQRKLRKALRCAPVYALHAIWAIPALLLIRATRRWVHVRMGMICHDRIGTFVPLAVVYLAHNALRTPGARTIILLWFPEPTCNEQWARMVKRGLVVRWWVRYLIVFNRWVPGGGAHDLPAIHHTRDIHGIVQRSGARFEFTPEEEAGAKAWLRRRGWQEGEPFVCLLVRDSAYLSSAAFQKLNRAGHTGEPWSYHDYRDSDIETYVETVQALLDKGYWVLRMGTVMHKRFPLNHRRVIDYPFVTDQHDLVDIWLSARCAFFISTGTGLDMIPIAYDRPVVFVNYNPITHLISFANGITIPKHLLWKDSGTPLTLAAYCQHSYLRSEDFKRAGIAIRDNSSEEIAAAVTECEQRLAGTWSETGDDRQRQRRFWEGLRRWPDFHERHHDLHPHARVGCAWLKSMGDAFFD